MYFYSCAVNFTEKIITINISSRHMFLNSYISTVHSTKNASISFSNPDGNFKLLINLILSLRNHLVTIGSTMYTKQSSLFKILKR